MTSFLLWICEHIYLVVYPLCTNQPLVKASLGLLSASRRLMLVSSILSKDIKMVNWLLVRGSKVRSSCIVILTLIWQAVWFTSGMWGPRVTPRFRSIIKTTRVKIYRSSLKRSTSYLGFSFLFWVTNVGYEYKRIESVYVGRQADNSREFWGILEY